MIKKLMPIILDFLNTEFYYSAVDNCVFCASNDKHKIGYQQIESIVMKTFRIPEDWAHSITFNWLLLQDVPLVKKDWNKTYMTHNLSVLHHHNQTITEDIDFEYKLMPKDPTKEFTITL